ncbi:MAG: helix-turn-helix domain-containing protein [Actinomycetota bacterium]
MPSMEEAARRQAVIRALSGEPVGKVAADLGRTERWVRKWVARYDPADQDWAQSLSCAPKTVANRTPEGLEHLVVEIRQHLMANQWAQVGAGAIAWEISKLGLDPPESWTIERILARAKVAKRRARPERYVPKGTPYPAGVVMVRAGACQEIDLVGPRHLEGAIPFHALNAIDVGRRRVAIEILETKAEWEIACGLVRIWSRLGIPAVAKFDNGQSLQGTHGHLSLPVRLALAVGVRVRFIPFAEPWRNPVIEHFNDVFDKRFFRTQRFRDLAHVREQASSFEIFHDTHHRYSALKGATPEEWERKLGFAPRLLDSSFTPPTELPHRGVVEFVRLIRSDRLLKVLDAKITMPEELIHRYVTAKLYLRTRHLVIEAHGHPFRKDMPFRIKP